MSYDGKEIANFVLDFCDKKDRKITNLALQKIVYFCHVWSLIEEKQPLIKHKFEAWEYGPVLQYLYREFKVFDRSPITTRAHKIDVTNGERRVATYNFDDKTTEFLQRVVDFYSRLGAGYLVELSHAEGGPWDKIWNHSGCANPGMRIEDDDIIQYYSRGPKPYRLQ